MIDSGATCNFIGLSLFRTLGLNLGNCVQHQVRLADGKMLSTVGEAYLRVNFGNCEYHGIFRVLPHDIPLILGMKFLSEFNPQIDFEHRTVCKHTGSGKDFLKVVRLGKARMPGQQQSAVVPTSNAFGALQEQLCGSAHEQEFDAAVKSIEDAPVKVEVTPVRESVIACKQCSNCGKKVPLDCLVGSSCRRCYNHSFEHQRCALVDVDGDGVSASTQLPISGDADVAQCADVACNVCKIPQCCCTKTVKSQHIGGARQGRPATCKGRTGIKAPSPRAGKGSSGTDHSVEFVSLK